MNMKKKNRPIHCMKWHFNRMGRIIGACLNAPFVDLQRWFSEHGY